jgi:hypothetical protein
MLPSRASTPIRFQTTITTADISATSISMALPEAIHSSNENYVPFSYLIFCYMEITS